MSKKKKSEITRIITAVGISGSLLLSACTGGGQSGGQQRSTPASPASPATPAESAATAAAPDPSGTNQDTGSEQGFPLFDEVTTFTWWTPYPAMAMQYITSPEETIFIEEMTKLTNVRFDFMIPPAGQEQEQFNLLIASDDLPDVISRAGLYKGGGDKAIEDKVYVKLNDLIDQYAPNYKALRESDPMLAKQTVSDSQNLWAFIPCNDFEDTTWWGPIARKDWLDDIGMSELPTDLEQWYEMLKAFKEEKNATAPLVNLNQLGYDETGGIVAGAFGIWPGYYQRDDVVYDGRYQEGFKEYLEYMNKLYEEELIDLDFPTRDGDSARGLFTSGQAGVVFESPDTVGSITDPMGIEIVGLPYPVKSAGDTLEFRMKQWNIYGNGATAITTECSAPEKLVQYIDYAYGEEGRILYNFGIEGETFEYDGSGSPIFTDYVLDNPDKIPLNAGIHIFRAHNEIPSFRYGSLSNPIPMQRPASQVTRRAWTEQTEAKYNLPPIEYTAEEGTIRAGLDSNLKPYRDEMILKFITGSEPISNFDTYVETCKSLGCEEDIAVVQQAYDRFNAR